MASDRDDTRTGGSSGGADVPSDRFSDSFADWFLRGFRGHQKAYTETLARAQFHDSLLLEAVVERTAQLSRLPAAVAYAVPMSFDVYLTALLRCQTFETASRAVGMTRDHFKRAAHSSSIESAYRKELLDYIHRPRPGELYLFDIPRVSVLVDLLLRSAILNGWTWSVCRHHPHMRHMLSPHSPYLYRRVRDRLPDIFPRLPYEQALPRVIDGILGIPAEELQAAFCKVIPLDGDLPDWQTRATDSLDLGERHQLAFRFGRKVNLN